MPKRKTMSEQLRQAAADSGLGVRPLAAEIDVEPASLCRFIKGERAMQLDALDRLAARLGLELRPITRKDGGR